MSELARGAGLVLVLGAALVLYGVLSDIGAPFSASLWQASGAAGRLNHAGAVAVAAGVGAVVTSRPRLKVAAGAMVLVAAMVLPWAVDVARARGNSFGSGAAWALLLGGVLILGASAFGVYDLVLGPDEGADPLTLVAGIAVAVCVVTTWWVPWGWQSLRTGGPSGIELVQRSRVVELTIHGWAAWPCITVTVVGAVLLARLLSAPAAERARAYTAVAVVLVLEGVARSTRTSTGPVAGGGGAVRVDHNWPAIAVTFAGAAAAIVLAAASAARASDR